MMMMTDAMKNYLDNLRESGEVNMFGASPYLAEVFGLSKAEAREVLGEWMRTFKRA
jgi:hypothetical protein